MADATDDTDDAGRLPGAFLATGSSSFVDFLGGHRPYLLPSRRRLPPVPPGFEPPHGTTIVGAVYDGGVLLAGDRRVTMGNQIAYRDYEKVFPADESSAVGIAGSTGLAEEMVGLFRMELAHYEKIEGVALTLEGRANRLGTLIRGNLELATQGLAVVPVYAGYDAGAGRGRIFAYFVDGGRMEERAFAGTGSGSVFARGAMKKLYREGMSEAEAVTMAVEALYDAADDDSATGGPDPTRRVYPQITVITEDGFRRVPDDEVAATTATVLRRRGERPDGPTAPVL